MKCFFSLLILSLFLSYTVKCYAQKPYLIAHGKIEYAFSNGMQTGTKVLIFKDSGAVEKVQGVTTTDTARLRGFLPDSMVSVPAITHVSIIQTLDSVFTINHDSQTYSARMRLTAFGIVDEYKKKIGEDIFMGKKCEVFSINMFKIWYWKGLALKKEMDIPGEGKLYEYATAIDENYVPNNDEFMIPKGMKLL